jgi:hypothetical protein
MFFVLIIIPRELDSTGKKIETDTTLELKLHIVLDKSSGITTFSSPLHKRMKPSDSPVYDCINENHETLESSVVSVSIFFPVESSSLGLILKLWLL